MSRGRSGSEEPSGSKRLSPEGFDELKELEEMVRIKSQGSFAGVFYF